MTESTGSGVIVRSIAYKPLPSQLAFHQCNTRFKIFSGPVGSGKSAALVHEVLRVSVLNPGLDGLLGSPTYRLLEDSTKVALLQVLEENSIPYVHKTSDNTITLSDFGTKILCRSMEDPERLRAMNLAWFAVDELTYCKEASFLRLLGRLRHPKAKFLTGFAACSPAGFNFVYDRFVGEKKTADYTAIRAVPMENVYLGRGYYEALANSYDERLYRQEVLGEFLSLQSGTAYYAFDRDRNLDPTITYDANCRLCWSLDFNIGQMASVIAQLRHTQVLETITKTIEIIDEIVIKDANVDLVCQAFCTRTAHLLSTQRRLKVNVYGDPAGNNRDHAGKSDWRMIRDFFARRPEYDFQYLVPSSHPAVRDRVNAMNGTLHNARGEVKQTIHPRCKTYIKDLERVSWKRDSNGNNVGDIDKSDPTLTHAADAAGYMCETEFSLNQVRISVI